MSTQLDILTTMLDDRDRFRLSRGSRRLRKPRRHEPMLDEEMRAHARRLRNAAKNSRVRITP